MVEATAPGKLVISGEYAVLEGAPAIAAAVGVTATARVEAAGRGRLDVCGAGGWHFDLDAAGRLAWEHAPYDGQGRVLEAVCAALAAQGFLPAGPLAIRLDSRAFTGIGARGEAVKLGLGSSAAIVTALTAALLAHAAPDAVEAERLRALAADAHRRFQGGGSGIDIAIAVYGGVIALEGGRVHRLAWPTGLQALAAWTGEGASTPGLLARVGAFRARDAAAYGTTMATLAAAAARVLATWEQGIAAGVVLGLSGYDAALHDFDAAGAIGIGTPAHRRLAAMARTAGAIYKTSGAGGGDFGIAFSTSAGVIERLRAQFAAEGVRTLPVCADTGGVACNTARS